MGLLVNGEYIDDAAIRDERNMIRQRLRQEQPDESPTEIETKAREWAQENVVERALLRQAAQKYSEQYAAPMGETGCATIVSEPQSHLTRLLESVTREVPRPQRREVVDFYKKNQSLFFTPECAHASHIVKNVDERMSEAEARSAMEIVQAHLRAGEPFAAVADEHSDCPGSGGELGWFSRGQMVEEFEAVVFRLKPAQLSEIFRSPFGFHVVQLHERRAAGVRPLPEVYSRVEEIVLSRRREQAIERFVDDLRAKAEIQRVSSTKPDPTS